MKKHVALQMFTLAALTVACGSPRSEPLARPDAPHAARFVSVRYAPSPVTPEDRPVIVRPERTAAKPPRAAPVVTVANVEPEPEPEPEEAYLPFELSDASFDATISSWRGFKTCVQARRAAGGAMKVAFQIENGGSVKKTKVLDTSNALARAIAPCVERGARRLSFPAFENDEDVTRVATFVF